MALPQQQGAPEQEMQHGMKPMPQQQPQMSGGGMPQQAGGMAPQMPQLNGEDVQMLLFSRIAEMNQQELQTLDSVITPETLPVLFKLLPELGILFEQASAIQGRGMAGEGMMEENGEGYEDEESDNPLINDNLSRGLMG